MSPPVPIWTFTEAEMAAKAASPETTTPWSCHPVYARYWQHYHQAMAWMRSHQNAYRKAVKSCFSSPWYFTPGDLPQSSYVTKGGSPQSFCDPHLASQGSHCGYSRSPRSGHHPLDSTSEDHSWSTKEATQTDSDAGEQDDLSSMGITEELRQYFAETERHREERRRRQHLDAQRLEDYVDADHDLYYRTGHSMESPSESPGERRQAEMKRLYGDSAAKIQAMEAAMHLSFYKHFDRKRPKYWPVIPLKF